MKKHTPGPWETFSHSDHIVGNYIPIKGSQPNRGWIAEAKGIHVNQGMTSKELIANANLIAAAPELLEALEAAFVQINADKSPELYAKMINALSKAKRAN